MPPSVRQQRVTLFLVKEGLKLKDVWSEDAEGDQTAVSVAKALSGTLMIGANKSRAPSWVKYLRPHVEAGQLDKLRNSSTASALAFEASGRIFVATFGYGRFLVRAEACEPDFGLKVAVNMVEPDHLKSIDARGFEELTLHTQRDVSRESAFSAFDLDVEKDVVRSITGSPNDDELARRLSGADALALNTHSCPISRLSARVFSKVTNRRSTSNVGSVHRSPAACDRQIGRSELDGLLVPPSRP